MFRECYADVSMIYLLEASRDRYFELASKEWETLKIDNPEPKSDSRYFVFLERVGTVLGSEKLWKPESGKEGNGLKYWIAEQEKEMQENQSELLEFLEDIKSFLKWIDEGEKKSTDSFHSRESMRFLRDYLEECHQTIHETFTDNSQRVQLDKLRNLYKTVSFDNSSDYKEYEECINQYRSTLV